MTAHMRRHVPYFGNFYEICGKSIDERESIVAFPGGTPTPLASPSPAEVDWVPSTVWTSDVAAGVLNTRDRSRPDSSGKGVTMFRVDLTNGESVEIVADRITFDEGAVWFWSDGVAIASRARSDVQSVAAMHEDAVERERETHARAFERWTDDEDERLRKARADGLTRVQLSELFERQPSAIRSRLDRLGLE